MILAVWMLISYTVTNFILHAVFIKKDPSQIKIIDILKHGVILLVTSLPIFLLVTYKNMLDALLAVGIIILIYLIIDYIKTKLIAALDNKKYSTNVYAIIFGIDQIIRIMIVLGIISQLPNEVEYTNILFLGNTFFSSAFAYEKLRNIFLLLYIPLAGVHFIPLILDRIYEKTNDYRRKIHNLLTQNKEKDLADSCMYSVKIEQYIGALERLLIVMLLINHQLLLIGVIIAVKGIANFKMMDNKSFADYFVVTTFTSVAYTLVTYSIFINIFS